MVLVGSLSVQPGYEYVDHCLETGSFLPLGGSIMAYHNFEQENLEMRLVEAPWESLLGKMVTLERVRMEHLAPTLSIGQSAVHH